MKHPCEKSRKEDDLRDGREDGLEPVRSVDLSKINTFDDLLRAYRDASFGARTLGQAADVLEAMTRDPDSFNVLTLSGAMTVGKMSLVICDMIDHGMVNAVVSTGALMAHGLVEAEGLVHYKVSPEADDRELYYKGYDRVYDTLELEKNLDSVERTVDKVLSSHDRTGSLSSQIFCHAVGKYLKEHFPDDRGVLKSAYEKGVPVYIPAFTDSEMGLDVGLFNRRMKKKGESEIRFDPILDLEHFTGNLITQKRLGIFTIGGGVPRNWAQQFGPYLDIITKRTGEKMPFVRYRYGVRICPEPAYWGGLSGCTYSEGVSWGKFMPPEEGGRYAEVLSDATLVWPILVKGVLQRLGK
jgi:deoxyhypusine synthase